MNDKTKIKLLMGLLAGSTAFGLVSYVIVKAQFKAMGVMFGQMKAHEAQAHDMTLALQKVVEVMHPTPEQRAKILMNFDIEKLEEILLNTP